MGKQSRIKAERRARRESNSEWVTAWSAVPEGARTGACKSDMCTFPNCLDPHVSVVELEGKPYEGPLVMVSYTAKNYGGYLKLNGGSPIRVPHPNAGEEALDVMQAAVTERFGQLGFVAVVHHLDERMIAMGLPSALSMDG